MFQTPADGFSRSVNAHNGRLDTQADWVEASVLFGTEPVSRSDIVDALIENNTYADQDFANEWVSNVLGELSRRFSLLGETGALVRVGDVVRRKRKWKTRPGYSFCLALAMLPHYRTHVEEACGKGYVEQGELFELLSQEALRALQWDVSAVGWSSTASHSVEERINALAVQLGEPASLPAAIERWTEPRAKDAGLDLVAWRSFPDGWAGRPICLLQCASGADWEDKLHTPNLGTWEKLIDFTTKPRRGLLMPFAPEPETFRRRASSDNVMLLMDRHRLLAPTGGKRYSTPPSSLAAKLVAWTEARVAAFPTDEE